MSLLAIGWEPELRGLLTVIIGVVVLMGSIYMIMATNMGSRLSFLVTLTGLMGWMALMGATWWIYGIGLKGPEPSWAAIPGQTIIQDVPALRSAGVLESLPDGYEDAPATEVHKLVEQQFFEEGYIKISTGDPAYGQAQAAASENIELDGALTSGQYEVTEVFDIGGERYPLLANNQSLDFFAFFHKPHFTVVEVSPLVPVRAEPGRAPAVAEIDEAGQRQYVYMVRDLGAKRQPAVVLTIGGGSIFLALCYLLHRRERILKDNLSSAVAMA
jgi:hypothetical protein|tara:strand:- start:1473 stop:2288 length:816 start_codon:yes stop_codon:yes gene_type:complete